MLQDTPPPQKKKKQKANFLSLSAKLLLNAYYLTLSILFSLSPHKSKVQKWLFLSSETVYKPWKQHPLDKVTQTLEPPWAPLPPPFNLLCLCLQISDLFLHTLRPLFCNKWSRLLLAIKNHRRVWVYGISHTSTFQTKKLDPCLLQVQASFTASTLWSFIFFLFVPF